MKLLSIGCTDSRMKEKVLDDIARMAGGGASVISGVGRQIKEDMRTRLEEIAMRLDLVPREDFEKLETMIAAYKHEQNQMLQRIEALETQLKTTKKT